jgi:acid phosphatase type 7
MDTTITVEAIKVWVRIMPDDDKARVMRARSFRCSLPLFLVLLAGCNRNTRVTNVPPPPGPPKAVVVVAVGDISCDPASRFYNQGNGTAKKCHMLATSSLAISIKPEAALLLGDTQYDTGSPSAFEQSYAKTWGRRELKDISYPSIGNHEYRTKHASGYFDYFGARAGDQRKGYYSFDLGTWHLIALNSGGDDACRPVSCDAGSDQERWLHDDLAQTTSACTLAFWHRPLFSSGELRESVEVRPLWRDLYDFNTDIVINGHVHHYERFAPQDPDGAVDTDHGILQFTVGTGGRDLGGFFPVRENSRVRLSHHFGVLKLELGASNYVWEFVTESGDILDSGSGQCHQKHTTNAK